LSNKLSSSEIGIIFRQAVKIECLFVDGCLQAKLIGMNSRLMKEYVEYCADRLIVQLGYDKIYNTVNPFDFMEMIGLQGKSNFFEKRVTEYNKAVVNKDSRSRNNKDEDNVDKSFGMNEDF
jgi:ribonucleotide reductase beta subunit family protein with ferritin-like domain